MGSSRLYRKLPFLDSIRLLELTQDEKKGSVCGHLILSKLEDTPSYAALSYVWGDPSPQDPLFAVDGFELRIRQSLNHALGTLLSGDEKRLLWIDQICIDQENITEREHQVTLMSKIFKQAQRVICWLGPDDEHTGHAFDLSTVLAIDGSGSEFWKEPMQRLMQAGLFRHMLDLVNPTGIPFSALAALVKIPWFGRLWIVQEVALASKIEFRCGGATIDGDITWGCKKSHDRLNALFGLAFPYDSNSAWFQPGYSITGPELYIRFAKDYINETDSLDILHFSGCGDAENYSLYYIAGTPVLEPRTPADDVPSWAPDWRVQSRPLVLLPDPGYNVKSQFAATLSKADYFFDDDNQTLHVRALLVDQIAGCGWPYYLSLCQDLQMTENEIFEQWYELAKEHLDSNTFETMFSSTLVMDARVTLTERGSLNVNQDEVPTLFEHWKKLVGKSSEPCIPNDALQSIEGFARYRYVAEEVCRNRQLLNTVKLITFILIILLINKLLNKANKGRSILIGGKYEAEMLAPEPRPGDQLVNKINKLKS
ncbi:hypothetical protein FGSG_11631 [Fusarium graminearum PH-1]|uniref:hypothetical protein n=1 Tax=Gibberella zeae (strain ATCC MYA-4620 / CBS 123657 / FGSC 9075 / NRRL 31084 / PH-1) TaxID=229533 RepID=UPI000023EF61|nr:hypothetical protein FGSG_11631 [Fusarium graminearum PH-1]ESU08374.1 hypothetical protein FGSG_11631 [Fusarium graminearum PH-1]|eukprot:XP_011320873.1 hypothetical protein FGSG_11631 [Fusarium graminearum PH-1]